MHHCRWRAETIGRSDPYHCRRRHFTARHPFHHHRPLRRIRRVAPATRGRDQAAGHRGIPGLPRMQLTTATAAPYKTHHKWIWYLLAGILLYFGVQYWRVAHQAATDQTRPADAIVVFGAAEYAGKPSPVYRARLDHAVTLYARRIAPVVITTGGSGGDPVHSEGAVGRDYLLEHGVPDKGLIAETQSGDTSESAE